MRVVTTNCDSRVPLSTQLAMWWMYDNMTAKKKDYFQVFELTAKEGCQEIFHYQEHNNKLHISEASVYYATFLRSTCVTENLCYNYIRDRSFRQLFHSINGKEQ